MGQPDLHQIIKEIKNRGLTAYEISKDLPLSEAGINKILNGNSSPRKSTLLLLHNYLFKSEESNPTYGNEKTPPEEVRFEDVITKKVFEEIAPLLNGNTEKLLKALANLHIEINKIKIAQMKTQESVKVIEERV